LGYIPMRITTPTAIPTSTPTATSTLDEVVNASSAAEFSDSLNLGVNLQFFAIPALSHELFYCKFKDEEYSGLKMMRDMRRIRSGSCQAKSHTSYTLSSPLSLSQCPLAPTVFFYRPYPSWTTTTTTASLVS
jgi:hypothetical protein